MASKKRPRPGSRSAQVGTASTFPGNARRSRFPRKVPLRTASALARSSARRTRSIYKPSPMLIDSRPDSKKAVPVPVPVPGPSSPGRARRVGRRLALFQEPERKRLKTPCARMKDNRRQAILKTGHGGRNGTRRYKRSIC